VFRSSVGGRGALPGCLTSGSSPERFSRPLHKRMEGRPVPECNSAGRRDWWSLPTPHLPARDYLLRLSVVFCLYFAAGKLGLAVPFTSFNVSPVWPAAGIALGAVLVWGGQVFPAIAFAAFLVNYLSGLPLWVALAIGLGNASSAVVGGYLLSRIPDFQVSFIRLRDVLRFVLVGAIGATAAAPCVGVTALTVAQMKPWSSYGSAWAIWWLGDAMGVIVVTPLVLALRELLKLCRSKQVVELAFLLLGILAVSMLIFGPHVRLRDDVLAFVVFPFILWAAIRFGPPGVAPANVIAAGVAVWGTARGAGPFISHSPLRNAELLQLFIAVTSLTGLILAAVISERQRIAEALESEGRLLQALRDAQAALAAAHRKLEQTVEVRTEELDRRTQQVAEQAALLDLASDAIFVRALDDRITSWNCGAERLYGWNREEVVGMPVQKILHTEFPQPFAEIREELLRTGTWQGELKHSKHNGDRITVHSRWSVWYDEEGRPLGFLELNTDISDRKQAEESLRELSGRLLTMQDEERRRIARELHDSTGQMIVALGLNLAVIEAEIGRHSAPASNACRDSIQLVRQISSEVRTISHLLHPPLLDEAGLPSALGWYVDGFSERSKIAVNLELSPRLGRLSPEVETAIFRIVQESLTNIHRHSQSETATIRIERNGSNVEIEVRDQGKGMHSEPTGPALRSQKKPGVGVRGMRERVAQLGGQFEIHSSENGTVVRVSLPLPPSDESGSSLTVPRAS